MLTSLQAHRSAPARDNAHMTWRPCAPGSWTMNRADTCHPSRPGMYPAYRVLQYHTYTCTPDIYHPNRVLQNHSYTCTPVCTPYTGCYNTTHTPLPRYVPPYRVLQNHTYTCSPGMYPYTGCYKTTHTAVPRYVPPLQGATKPDTCTPVCTPPPYRVLQNQQETQNNIPSLTTYNVIKVKPQPLR